MNTEKWRLPTKEELLEIAETTVKMGLDPEYIDDQVTIYEGTGTAFIGYSKDGIYRNIPIPMKFKVI